MLLAIKMAYRNLIGAGLRTWLNVIVLSFSFVIIIWMKGVMAGWDHQAKTDMKNWAIGGGQYWHELYDPYDPLTLSDAHAPIPEEFRNEIGKGNMEPVLVVQGTIYPQGRMQAVLVKGINPGQSVLKLPTQKFDSVDTALPAIIGASMARSSQLKVGDFVTLRWRDIHGTFDAAEVVIAAVFLSNVPAAEAGQVYLPLDRLQSMTGMTGEATFFTFRDKDFKRVAVKGWIMKDFPELTKQIDEVIKAKTIGQSVFYFILILLAMLAIFDTQVLSIFRRQKEIGTYIALGFTRQQVVGLFTVEGTMHAILAALLSAAYGIPFLMWQAKVGWTMPMDTSQFGMAIAQTLYPVYSAGLIAGTILLVTLTTAIVSYWPSRRIAKMNPTEALRGKLQ